MKVKSRNEIPSDWKVMTIQEVADVNPRLKKEGIPDNLAVSFVPMPSVGAGDGSIDVSQSRVFSDVKKGYTAFQEGDVLFAKITPCMENGKMTVVPMVINGYGFGSTEFHVLRPKPGISAKYLYHFISSKDFRSKAERYMTGAVGQKRVSATYLKEHSIPVAPLEQQESIVAEIEKQFSRLDEAVTSLKRAKANLKRYKVAVLKAAVEGKLTEEWRKQHPDVEPASELLKRILGDRRRKWEENELAKIRAKGKEPTDDIWKKKYKKPLELKVDNLPKLPSSWLWVSIEQISTLVTDGDHNPPKRVPKGVPHLTAKSIISWKMNEKDCSYIHSDDFIKVSKRYMPKKGDVIITCVGTIGRTAIVPDGYIFSADRNLAVVRLITKGMAPKILQINLNTSNAQKRITSASGSTAQPHFYLSELRSFPVVLMPAVEQEEIINIVEEQLSKLEINEKVFDVNQKRLDRLRQSILNKAFFGQFFKIRS